MILVLVAVFGLAVGSLLNVLVFRTHADVPLTRRSACLVCEEPIGWFDLIPVVSFLALRGRCRRCKSAISWQYPLVEIATMVLFVLIAWITLPMDLFSVPSHLPLFLRDAIFSVFLIIIFVYDLKYRYILDKFTVPGMILAVVLNFALGAVTVQSMLFGALAVGGFFGGQYLLSKGQWIGGGDIRLGILMGLMVGFWPGVLALFIGYVMGAVSALFLICMEGKRLQRAVPFGTFLTVGTVVAMLWGQRIIDWYLGYLR